MPIPSLVAGIFAVVLVLLSGQISLRRATLRVVFGDAGDLRGDAPQSRKFPGGRCLAGAAGIPIYVSE